MTVQQHKARAAFTLIELLVVMVIIGILTSIIIGVAGNVRKKAAKNRAAGEIAAIDLALERYKIDNGDYPSFQGASISGGVYAGNPSSYTTAGSNLFAAIVGRVTYSGTQDTTQYFEVKEGQTTTTGGKSYLTDPFGYAYGYYYKYDGISTTTPNQKSQFNEVVPDVWSTSGETSNVSLTSTGDGKSYARYLNWSANWPNK